LDHLFNLFPVLFEPQKNTAVDHQRRGRHPAEFFDKLLPGRFVRTDIPVGKFNPFCRKKIFQCMAIASVWRSIKDDFRFFFHFPAYFY
jgi:hypothetical protein